jgi:hypothetical protein
MINEADFRYWLNAEQGQPILKGRRKKLDRVKAMLAEQFPGGVPDHYSRKALAAELVKDKGLGGSLDQKTLRAAIVEYDADRREGKQREG